jgi:hypothetical protein
MASSDHDHLIDTGKGSFSIDELGPLLPGMAEIMPLVGDRTWRCYYGAKAKNWPLAAFQLKEAVNLLRKASVLRPKYRENVERFIANKIDVVTNAIDAADWLAFEEAFDRMVTAANAYHDYYDKPFLQWKLPATPPDDLTLPPRS